MSQHLIEDSKCSIVGSTQEMHHVVIAKNLDRHLAFPDACRLNSGEVLVVYREGAAHVDYSGRVMVCRCGSVERGETFSSPMVVCDTEWDDRDPSIMQLSQWGPIGEFFSNGYCQ